MTVSQENECFLTLQDFFFKLVSNNSMKRERFETLYRSVYVLVCRKKINELNDFLIKNLLNVALYASKKEEFRKKLSLIRDVFMSLEKNINWKNYLSVYKIGLLTRAISFQIRLNLIKHGFEKLYYRCFRLSFAPNQRAFLREIQEFEKN